MRRCVGMADEGDSKSLVLITRVGSTPTTGIKKRTSPACLGEFSFLSAARERVEQHSPDKECSGNVSRPHLPDRMVYRSGNGAVLFCAAASAFFCCAPCVCRQSHSTLFFPRRRSFLPAVFVPAGSPGFPENGCLFYRKVVLCPGKSIEIPLRPFILLFLSVFTMFFAKKTLQMNFKNILYNYKFNIFTQIVSYWFV